MLNMIDQAKVKLNEAADIIYGEMNSKTPEFRAINLLYDALDLIIVQIRKDLKE